MCVIIIVINYLYNNWTEHMHVWLESRLSLFLYSCLSLLFYLNRILYWQLYTEMIHKIEGMRQTLNLMPFLPLKLYLC